MSNRKLLGKITKAKFGLCGYQEQMLGLKLCFEGDGWVVHKDIIGGWDYSISPTGKWTEADRQEGMDKMMREVATALRDSNSHSVDELKGVPVEVEFDSASMIAGWRILKEVL